jgi:hypothetical protein
MGTGGDEGGFIPPIGPAQQDPLLRAKRANTINLKTARYFRAKRGNLFETSIVLTTMKRLGPLFETYIPPF